MLFHQHVLEAWYGMAQNVRPTQITIDISRMFLNVPGMSWLSLEHSMDKCGYLGIRAQATAIPPLALQYMVNAVFQYLILQT